MGSLLEGILAGGGTRPGFKVPSPNELFTWPCIWKLGLGGLNLCINRVVLLEFLVCAVVGAVFLVSFRRPRIVPKGGQNVLEALYEFVAKDVVEGVIGPKGALWAPYLMILMTFAFFASLLEVVPGLQFPVSSRMAMPLLLAIISWLIYNFAGVVEKGFGHYFKAIMFPPGVPKLAYVLLTPIELLAALVIRPFTLAIRLFANFFAGHLVLVVFFVATAYLVGRPLTVGFGVASLALSVLLVGLEIFIAAVQAYVFTLLTAVYVSLSVSHEH